MSDLVQPLTIETIKATLERWVAENNLLKRVHDEALSKCKERIPNSLRLHYGEVICYYDDHKFVCERKPIELKAKRK